MSNDGIRGSEDNSSAAKYDPNGADTCTEPVLKQLRPKLVHIAIALGYVGTRYSGSQWQAPSVTHPHICTVEGEVYAAIEAAGLLYGRDIKSIGWTRCSRTDKSVSAAMAVFSFFAPINLDLVQALQPHLPKDISIFGTVRVPPKFNAKMACTSRTYEYIMPLAFLLPSSQDKTASLCPDMETFFSYLNSPLSTGGTETIKEACSRLYTAQRHDILDFLQLDGELREVRASLCASCDSPADMFDTILQPFLQKLINTVFLTRIRAYHNFTEDNVQPSASSRKILSCSVSPSAVFDSQDSAEKTKPITELHTKITICGQAFLMYQIRRMMGALVAIVRGWVPVTFLYFAFQTRTKHLRMSTAPGHYLLLKQPNYEHLLSKKDFTQHGTFISEDERIKRLAESFKADNIYPEIVRIHKNLVSEGRIQTILDEMKDELCKYESGWKQARALFCEDIRTQTEISDRTITI